MLKRLVIGLYVGAVLNQVVKTSDVETVTIHDSATQALNSASCPQRDGKLPIRGAYTGQSAAMCKVKAGMAYSVCWLNVGRAAWDYMARFIRG